MTHTDQITNQMLPLALCAAWLRRGQRPGLRGDGPLWGRTVQQAGGVLVEEAGLLEEAADLAEVVACHMESVWVGEGEVAAEEGCPMG